jgi:hypothetical protein
MSDSFISYFNTYDYTGSISTSSYALPFTPLTFAPILSTGSEFLSDKKIVWDFGDGTSVEALTGVHAYKEQGTYTVRNFLFDKNGQAYQNPYQQEITIKNYLTDTLLITASNNLTYTLTAGKIRDPFLITNAISWQALSGDIKNNIPIVSYISGGNSYDYFRDEIATKHYGHLYPSCSTCLLLTSINGITEYAEVSSFTTIATPIYIKLSGGKIVNTDKFDIDAFFCGLTGYRQVYFKNDVSTPGANLFFGYQPDTLYPFANTSTVGVTIEVKENTDYNKLSITSNGLDGEGNTTDLFNIGKTKFSNTKVGFVIKVKDNQDFSIKGIPQISDVELILTDGVTIFVQDNSLSAIPYGGFYKGYFIANLPYTTNNVFISANGTILKDRPFGDIRLTGTSNTFTVYPSSGVYNIAKKGEYIDFKQTFKDLAFQPLFLDKKILFDDFLGSIFGNLSSAQTAIGKTTYEKIENFVDNNATLDYSNINQLASLLKSANIDLTKFTSYNLNFPSAVGRLVNLLSINHSRLFGTQNAFKDNFKTYGYYDHSSYGSNLGPQLPTDSYITISNEYIVAFEKFSGKYKLVNNFNIVKDLGFWVFEPTIDATISNFTVDTSPPGNVTIAWTNVLPPNAYPSTVVPSGSATNFTYTSGVLSTANDILSATSYTFKIEDYENRWGWGLLLPEDGYGKNINNYYLFYEYNPQIDGTITNSIINFDDFNTTLSYTMSSYSDWSQKDGIISNILAKSLYDGLDLFVENLPALTSTTTYNAPPVIFSAEPSIDTDGDGYSDSVEISNNTNPNDANSFPVSLFNVFNNI